MHSCSYSLYSARCRGITWLTKGKDMTEYAVEIQADDSGKWISNNLVFTSVDKATTYALDLRMRLTIVREWRIVEAKRSE